MGTRHYLKAEDRRGQLLEATSRVFERDGLLGISMVAVAAEAGVSRRLIYDHFTDLGTLYEAFFSDRGERYLAAIDRALTANHGVDPHVAVAYAEFLAMPAVEQQAVRMLVAGPGLPDLEPTRRQFRQGIEDRWLPSLPAPSPEQARALLWSLVSGLLGLAELVAIGQVRTETAVQVARGLVLSATQPVAAST